MTALAPLSPPSAAALPRPPWRALALLTLAVAAAHLLLLALAPTGLGPDPLPLANRFSTRTIVITPPAPQTSNAAPPPPKATAPAPAPTRQPPRPARPRAVEPRAAPMPAPSADAAAEPAAAEAVPAASGTPAGDASGSPGADGAAGGSGQNAGLAGMGTGGTPGATRALIVPGSVRLRFAVTAQRGAQPLTGGFGELVWNQDGNRYEAQLVAKVLFIVLTRWSSAGVVGPDGIEPTRYADSRRSEVAAHFERERGAIVFSNNTPAVPLLAGAQDRLTVMLQLGALLAGDPGRYPPGSRIALQTATTRDADVWAFTVEGEETLSLPAGEIRAIKLTRPPRRDYDLKVDLWLSPGHNYLPARLVLTEPNGDFADFQMRELHPPSPPS